MRANLQSRPGPVTINMENLVVPPEDRTGTLQTTTAVDTIKTVVEITVAALIPLRDGLLLTPLAVVWPTVVGPAGQVAAAAGMGEFLLITPKVVSLAVLMLAGAPIKWEVTGTSNISMDGTSNG